MKIASRLGKGPEVAVLLRGCTGRRVPEERQIQCGKRRGEGQLQTAQKSTSATTSSEVRVKLSPPLKQDKYISNFIYQIVSKFSDTYYLKYSSIFLGFLLGRWKRILQYVFILHLELPLHFEDTLCASSKCAPIHSMWTFLFWRSALKMIWN